MDEENKMTITNDLQTISKELMKLVKQTEKLAAAIGNTEKPKVKSVKTKTKAKAVAKKAPAKAAKVTATDQVLNIINRSKNGVDTPTPLFCPTFDSNFMPFCILSEATLR